MAKGQRQPKRTPEIQEKLVEAIGMGATIRLACAYAGVSEDTFARWRDASAEFADAIKKAEGEGAMKWLIKIERAASEGTWQAAAWKLERLYPNEYGRTVQEVQHSGTIDIELVAGIRAAVAAAFPDDPHAPVRIAEALHDLQSQREMAALNAPPKRKRGQP